jgi:hypothetical protein
MSKVLDLEASTFFLEFIIKKRTGSKVLDCEVISPLKIRIPPPVTERQPLPSPGFPLRAKLRRQGLIVKKKPSQLLKLLGRKKAPPSPLWKKLPYCKKKELFSDASSTTDSYITKAPVFPPTRAKRNLFPPSVASRSSSTCTIPSYSPPVTEIKVKREKYNSCRSWDWNL